ncbi:hypothetical protein TNCV_907961 [Trichonephila clavipes]|nr:hypothetical protein TNCV_907961 [Trichonephila clavipes]
MRTDRLLPAFGSPYGWLATLTAMPYGLGSNPREDMDICKCIAPLRHGGTLNNREVPCPLVRLVEGEEMWETPEPFPTVFSLKIVVEPS